MLNIISRAYCSSVLSGPKKVVINLIKGLDSIGYPYVVNKALDATTRLWIHDDINALTQVVKLPNDIKIVAGPNLFIAPRFVPKTVDLSKVVLSFPCLWTKSFWQDFGFNQCPIEICPSGIDTQLFSPSNQEKNLVTVYFKKRDNIELEFVSNLLKQKNIAFQILEYGKYSESFFKQILQSTKLVIWLGCSESQGIALQEILSCNIPVIVCESDNMNKNLINSNGFNTMEANYKKATSAPYFNNQCGIIINNLTNLNLALENMLNSLNSFQPRDFVVTNFNLEKQAKEFLNIFNTYYGLTYKAGLNEKLRNKKNFRNNSLWFKLFIKLKDLVKKLKRFL